MSALPDVPPNPFGLEFVHAEVVCFAMEQAGIPIVRDVRVHNAGAEPLRGAELGIQLQPDLGAEQRFRIRSVGSNDVCELARPDVRLEPGRLRKVLERERARLCLRVYAHSGECLVEEVRDIDVLAFNEWPGQRAPLGLLASFVTPNHMALMPLLAGAKAALAAATGSSQVDGYRARSKERVLHCVRAAFQGVAQCGLAYASLPPSFEETGQKVRLVDTMLAERAANCLDSTLLLAALLECFGLRPLLVLADGHALLAVWLLEDQFPEGLVEDVARLRTQLELGQILAIESTLALGEQPTRDAFEMAVAKARDALAGEAGFVAALDVHVLRDDGFRPLSFRALDGQSGELPAERETIDLESTRQMLEHGLREPERDGRDQTVRPVSRTARRFQKWKDGLLDLTLRNTLLNFRTHRRGALPLDVPAISQFEDLLAAD